jgi:maleate cis-trans isomerase
VSRTFRVGPIVPGSNTIMEMELPAILRGREAVRQQRFAFYWYGAEEGHDVKVESADSSLVAAQQLVAGGTEFALSARRRVADAPRDDAGAGDFGLAL